MRKTMAGIAAAIVGSVVLASVTAKPAAADPTNQCYGQIVAGIASTWPWAHDDRVAFQPPPGAVALWIKLFGPDAGVSSVRDLQVLFCGEN